jgi:hypothetical protein
MTVRTRPPEGAARRVGATSVPPALMLVVGLAVLAVVVASTGRLSPSALIDKFGTQSGLFPVNGIQVAWDSRPFDPFSAEVVHRSWGLTIGLTIVYLGSVTALGSGIVGAVRGDDRWPRPVSVLAGFLPGYLMMLAPLQLLFAAVPYRTAAWIALAGAPVAALIVHRRAAVDSATSVARDGGARRGLGWTAVTVVTLVVVALVHRLQVDRSYLTQDSISWFVVTGADQLGGWWGSYLGQWDQQSDEWVFNAPLMFSSHNIGDLWFPFYATQAVGIASFGALAFGIVHRLARRRKRLAAGVAVAVMFGLTPAIYPWLYVPSVAGGQPLVEMGHTGRFVGIVAPWVAALVVGRRSRPVVIALGLATLGLGFVSVNALVSVLAGVAAGLAWRAAPARGVGWLRVGAFRRAMCLLPVAAVGTFVCAFWWMHVAQPSSSAWWLVSGTVVAVTGAVVLIVVTPDRPTLAPRPAVWAGLWSCTLVVGLLLSNNLTDAVLHGRVRHVLALVLPGYDGKLLNRPTIGDGMFNNLSFPKVSDQACLTFIPCGGVADFLAAFGLVLVLALVTWFALGPVGADAAVNVRRFALLLLVAAFGTGLLIVFFTGGDPPGPTARQPIIFSRFLEAPYYGLLALAAVTFAESRSRATAIAGTTVLILWTVIPVIATRRPEEWVRNAGWLVRHTGIAG